MADYVPKNKKEVKRKSAVAFYAAAGVFLAYAVLFPLFKLMQFVLALVITAVVFFVIDKNAAVKSEFVDKTDKELSTGDEEADALLKSARANIASLKQYGMKAEDEQVKQQLMRITVTADKIVDYVNDNPKSAAKVRQFLNYFLPTTKKLMDNYMVLAVQKIRGENIDTTMEKIEGMLEQTADAFERQLDSLFADTAMDVSADISVMQNLMAQGGISPAEEAETEDGGIKLQL